MTGLGMRAFAVVALVSMAFGRGAGNLKQRSLRLSFSVMCAFERVAPVSQGCGCELRKCSASLVSQLGLHLLPCSRVAA